MKVDDKTKMRVIVYIDNLRPKLKKTIYDNELLALRKKYIYKDIFVDELRKDVYYLREMKSFVDDWT